MYQMYYLDRYAWICMNELPLIIKSFDSSNHPSTCYTIFWLITSAFDSSHHCHVSHDSSALQFCYMENFMLLREKNALPERVWISIAYVYFHKQSKQLRPSKFLNLMLKQLASPNKKESSDIVVETCTFCIDLQHYKVSKVVCSSFMIPALHNLMILFYLPRDRPDMVDEVKKA